MTQARRQALSAVTLRQPGPRLRALPARLFALLVSWSERHRQRSQLRALEARELRDLGITEADVAQECAKPFWRP